MSETELLKSYPILSAADLARAWAYVSEHSKEVEQQIAENEADAE